MLFINIDFVLPKESHGQDFRSCKSRVPDYVQKIVVRHMHEAILVKNLGKALDKAIA